MSTAVDETTEPEVEEGAETPPEPLTGDEAEEEESGDEGEQGAAEASEELEAPSAAGLTEKEAEKRFERMAGRANTFRNAISDVLGELALDLEPCPRCMPMTPGFYYPAAEVTPEQRVAVKLSIGELVEPEYRADKNASVCGGCNGHGKVQTGSLVPTQRVLRCEDCEGKGWIGPRAARTQAPAAPLGATDGEGLMANTDAKPLTDPWGRTIDDPLYGIMPGFERD